MLMDSLITSHFWVFVEQDSGRGDFPLLAKMEAGCSNQSSVELDAGMCGFSYRFCSSFSAFVVSRGNANLKPNNH